MSDNPYAFLKNKKGVHERVSVRAGKGKRRVIADRKTNEDGQGFRPEQPMDSVGLSLTVGMSTEFGREKVEITAWESRAVHQDPADKRKAREEIAASLVREAQERLDGAIREFFPHMLEDENAD